MKSLVFILLFIVFQSHAQISDFNHIDFKKADSIALGCKDEGLDNLPQLTYQLTSSLDTDVERFRAIYRWVCNNVANDYNLYLKNKRKRERFKDDSIKFKTWSNNFRKTLFKTLLKDQRTICTGYAYLVKELAKLANLDCEIVQGYGRVSTTDIENLDLPNHSWNAIKLKNKWYLCDPTWASGIPDPETNRFTFQYNDGFFLANPELFAVNHFPEEAKWWLLDKEIPTFETFLASPIIYGKAYKNLSLHIAPKQMHHTIKKHENVAFEYKLIKTITPKDISLMIDNGFNNWKTKPQSVSVEDKSLILEHQFKTSGFYDVHLYIGDDLISTYTFSVEN
ncbi:transglutaminase domain-containing protein [uncultured Winogradskyella sp.]|uniref:transglutaminase domain-containing protein n=1 Tax=uncultured Winogradskyella sp. TaxID=395353 RepID=UPI00262F7682|nr:transglutaminase domain-containing protein [uncultured Winogradskyella sp.]